MELDGLEDRLCARGHILSLAADATVQLWSCVGTDQTNDGLTDDHVGGSLARLVCSQPTLNDSFDQPVGYLGVRQQVIV